MDVAVDTLQHRVIVESVARGRRGSGPGEFHYPASAVVVRDRAYVVDSWNHRVQVFRLPAWEFDSEFGEFFCPRWIEVLHRDEPLLVVVDTNNRRLSFHDLAGTRVSTVDLRYPRFPVRADIIGGNALMIRYEDGHQETVGWGFGSNCQKPLSLARDSSGCFYISDFGKRTVDKFDVSGRFIAQILGPEKLVTPRRMAMHFGDLLISDSHSHSIFIYDTLQGSVRRWEHPFPATGLIGRDSSEQLWIGPYAPEPNGEGTWFTVFDRNYQFQRRVHFADAHQPAAITFHSGRIYIADQKDDVVRIFDGDTRLLETVPAGQYVRCVEHDGDGKMHIGNYPVADLLWDPRRKEMYQLDFAARAVSIKT